ncbi:MAG: mannose-6-phosphate isomerase-like protein (cupin superfamily) [Oceanicoccus sp.]
MHGHIILVKSYAEHAGVSLMSDDIVEKAWWSVLGSQEGESIWLPKPANGHVTLKFTADNMPFDTFASGIQELPPGGIVPKHAHAKSHELTFVYEGTGRAEIEDETLDFGPGTTLLMGPNTWHMFENTGDTVMRMFWVFYPPGLDDWFRGIGKPRQLDDAVPKPFSRPDNIQELMEQLHFVPPKAD